MSQNAEIKVLIKLEGNETAVGSIKLTESTIKSLMKANKDNEQVTQELAQALKQVQATSTESAEAQAKASRQALILNQVYETQQDKVLDLIKVQNLTTSEINELITSLKAESSTFAIGSAEYNKRVLAMDKLNVALGEHHQSLRQSLTPQQQFTSGSGQMNHAITQLGWVMGDADMFLVNFRMGMMSIGNNIPMVVQAFTEASRSAKETGQSFMEVAKGALAGGGGLILAVNAAMFAMNMLAHAFQNSSKESKENSNAIKDHTTDLLVEQKQFQSLTEVIGDVNKGMDERKRALQNLKSQFPDYLKQLNLEKVSTVELSDALREANNEFEKKIKLQVYGEKFKEVLKNQVELEQKILDLKSSQAFVNAKTTIASGISYGGEGANEKYYNAISLVRDVEAEVLEIEEDIADSKQRGLELQTRMNQNVVLPDLSGNTITAIESRNRALEDERKNLDINSERYKVLTVEIEQNKKKLEEATKSRKDSNKSIKEEKEEFAEIQRNQKERELEHYDFLKRINDLNNSLEKNLQQINDIQSISNALKQEAIRKEYELYYAALRRMEAEAVATANPKGDQGTQDFINRMARSNSHIYNKPMEPISVPNKPEITISAANQLNHALMNTVDISGMLGSSMQSATSAMVSGFSQSLQLLKYNQSVAQIFINSLGRILAEMVVLQTVKGFFNLATGGVSGFLGGFMMDIPKLATGGVVTKPTLSLIGEAGPEAVIPLNRLNSMPAPASHTIVQPIVNIQGSMEVDTRTLRNKFNLVNAIDKRMR